MNTPIPTMIRSHSGESVVIASSQESAAKFSALNAMISSK